jgi:tRNA(Ile)-lysidine synthase
VPGSPRWACRRCPVARTPWSTPNCCSPRHDAQPSYRWAGLRLERWRGLLHVEAQAPSMPAAFTCAWNGQARLQLPDGASLETRARQRRPR